MSSGTRKLTVDERNSMVQFLLANHTNGSVHHGKIKEAAGMFNVNIRTVHYHWSRAKTQLYEGRPAIIVHQQRGNEKRKRVELNIEKMQDIPFQERGSIRKLAKKLGASKSSVGRWIKDKQITPHTNAIHPELTADNKLQRVKFALNQIVYDNMTNKLKFSSMKNVVHIDEKWFYITRTSQRMYKLPDEVAPYRSCKSKRYITKIMFMCAVSRPVYDSQGEVIFDGKIGIFPFTKEEPAVRNSKNRPRGTLETKPIDSVTKEVVKECLVNQIIPAIKAKWPSEMSKDIYIQQDNAKPHILNSDLDFRAAASSDGFNIQLVCQPSNSPETNINDLGWFRAIQSQQLDTAANNVDELLNNVMQSFKELSSTTLNNVFLTFQCVLVEILKAAGHNDFKIPHMGKASLLRKGRLPDVLEVEEELVRDSIEHVFEAGQMDGHIMELMTALGC